MPIENDPILSSIVKAKQISEMTMIKHKNRILLPQSASLIGVMDPWGILEHN